AARGDPRDQLVVGRGARLERLARRRADPLAADQVPEAAREPLGQGGGPLAVGAGGVGGAGGHAPTSASVDARPAASSATTWFSSAPIPSISQRTVSPTCRWLMPLGVPVQITSSSWSVMNSLTYSMISGIR